MSWQCHIGWHDWQWRILWGVGPGDNMDARCARCTAITSPPRPPTNSGAARERPAAATPSSTEGEP